MGACGKMRSTKGWTEHEPYSNRNINKILEGGGYKETVTVVRNIAVFQEKKSRDLEEVYRGFDGI